MGSQPDLEANLEDDQGPRYYQPDSVPMNWKLDNDKGKATLAGVKEYAEPISLSENSEWAKLLSEALDYENQDFNPTDEDKKFRLLGTNKEWEFASLDITTLQRLNLYHLQHKLAQAAKKIDDGRKKGSVPIEEMDKLPDLLKSYFDSLRDAVFCRKAMKNNDLSNPVFQLLYLYNGMPGVTAMMADVGVLDRAEDPQPRLPRVPKDWDFLGSFLQGEKEKKEQKLKEFGERLLSAVVGGVALVAPLLIMTLRQTRVTCLVTTSVFVLIVALLLAWFKGEAKSQDVIGATAAYAAVLVVLVGTSLSSK